MSIENYFDRSFELESLLQSRGKIELYKKMVEISELANILYVRQREPLGLGHAVLCGEPFCRGDYFGVVLPDDVFLGEVPIMAQLIGVHRRLGGTLNGFGKLAPLKETRATASFALRIMATGYIAF